MMKTTDDNTMKGEKQDNNNKREIKFLSYAIYVCDGYKRVGFISRWEKKEMDFATSLDARDWRPFSYDEVWEVRKVLNFFGITHCVLAVSDLI